VPDFFNPRKAEWLGNHVAKKMRTHDQWPLALKRKSYSMGGPGIAVILPPHGPETLPPKAIEKKKKGGLFGRGIGPLTRGSFGIDNAKTTKKTHIFCEL